MLECEAKRSGCERDPRLLRRDLVDPPVDENLPPSEPGGSQLELGADERRGAVLVRQPSPIALKAFLVRRGFEARGAPATEFCPADNEELNCIAAVAKDEVTNECGFRVAGLGRVAHVTAPVRHPHWTFCGRVKSSS